MTHAVGHSSRLNREGVTQQARFGSERYSKEELIAELGAAFLAHDAGILDRVRFDNSAAYLGSWIAKLSAHGLIVVTHVSNPTKGHCANLYRFLWHPWMQTAEDSDFRMVVREEQLEDSPGEPMDGCYDML
jgi:antirestriction protein ArdC